MKHLLILMLLFIILTACSQTEAAPTTISTPIPPTSTIPPTVTHTPEPTLTPTPVPYYLEDGSLYDLDETTSEYALVAEGIADITTSTDGLLVARGESGEDMYKYNADAGEWEAVEIMPTSCNDPELINRIVEESEAEAGMSLHDLWLQGKEDPDYARGMVYGGGEFGRSYITLKPAVISMKGREGFSDTDRMICEYLYSENDNGEDVYVVPVELFVEKNGRLLPLTRIDGVKTKGTLEYEQSMEESVSSFEEALKLVNRNRLGGINLVKLQVDWNEGDGEIATTVSRLKYLDNIRMLLSDDYVSRMKDNEMIWEALEDLEPDDDGFFAQEYIYYSYEPVE